MLREDGPPRRAQDWSNCGTDIAALVQCTVDVLSSEVDDAGGPEPAANAFYGVLNICRVLQLRHEDTRRVHSKDETARWVIQHLPTDQHDVVWRAWAAYRSADEATQRQTARIDWPTGEFMCFRDFARTPLDLT